MGEGLSLGKSRDTAFILTGVLIWVGNPAYLAADLLTIQEGQQEIAWAITDLTVLEIFPERTPLEVPIQTISYHLTSLQEARTAIDIEDTRGYHHLSSHCHPCITDSKVIAV